MRKNYGIWLGLMCALMLTIAAPSIAHAQSEAPFVVTFGLLGYAYSFDTYIVTEEDTIVDGSNGNPSPSALGQWYANDGFSRFEIATVEVTLPDGCLLEQVSFDVSGTPEAGGITRSVSYSTDNGSSWSALYDVTNTDLNGGTWYAVNAYSGSSIAADKLTFNAIAVDNGNTSGNWIRIDNLSFTCDGMDGGGGGIGDVGPFQPISLGLQTGADIPRTNSGLVNGTSIIYASTEGSSIAGTVPVYSPVDATVVATGATPPFRVKLYAEVEGHIWDIDIFNLENIYVKVGDKVDAGCIIGYAGISPEESFPISPNKAIAYTILSAEVPEIVDWTLHSNPEGTAICGSLAKEQNCLNNNPDFINQAAGWSLNRGLDGKYAIAPHDEILLQGISSVSQFVELEEDTEYYVTVSIATVSANSGAFNVTVGGETLDEEIYADNPSEAIFGVGIGQFQTKLIGPFTPGTPDLFPSLYNLEIKNSFLSRDLKLAYACIHELAISPIDSHGLCYFSGLSDFTTDGDNLTDPLGNPYTRLYDGDMMAANITLKGYADGDAVYNIHVNAWPYYKDSMGDPATATNLDLSFNDGTEYATVATHELQPDVQVQVIYTIEIPEDGEVTADLTITHNQDDATDSGVVDISRVCLVAERGYFPGYDPSPKSDLPECPPVLAPEFTLAGFFDTPFKEIQRLGIWAVSSIISFLTCFIPREIKKVINEVGEIVLWIRSIGIWWGAVMQVFATWLKNGLAYFGALIASLFGGLFSLIWDAIIAIPLVQQLFDQFSLAQLWAILLAAIAEMVLAIMTQAFLAMASLVAMIRVFFIALRFGYNNASTPELDIPLCDGIDTDSIGYAFCAGLDLTDYGLAAFWVAEVFIYIAIGSVIYFAIIKTFEMARNTMENFG